MTANCRQQPGDNAITLEIVNYYLPRERKLGSESSCYPFNSHWRPKIWLWLLFVALIAKFGLLFELLETILWMEIT